LKVKVPPPLAARVKAWLLFESPRLRVPTMRGVVVIARE
jgi:hypothetical protein